MVKEASLSLCSDRSTGSCASRDQLMRSPPLYRTTRCGGGGNDVMKPMPHGVTTAEGAAVAACDVSGRTSRLDRSTLFACISHLYAL